MKLNHCTSSRRFLQEEAPFRNNPSPSVTFSPDPLLNATSMSSTPAMKKPFKLASVPFDSSMALTVLILVTALFFLAFFSVYLRRLSSSSSSSTSPRRLPASASSPPPPSSSSRSGFSKGLDASTIKSIPQVAYGAAAKHPIDCPICLAEFDENDTVKMIPHCGHVFHPTCLDTWLSSHVTCPLCRSTRIGFGSGEEVQTRSTRISVGSGEEVRLAVAQEDGVSEFGENLTVDQGDTLREVGSLGVRRTCSCSSIGNPACLQRSMSL